MPVIEPDPEDPGVMLVRLQEGLTGPRRELYDWRDAGEGEPSVMFASMDEAPCEHGHVFHVPSPELPALLDDFLASRLPQEVILGLPPAPSAFPSPPERIRVSFSAHRPQRFPRLALGPAGDPVIIGELPRARTYDVCWNCSAPVLCSPSVVVNGVEGYPQGDYWCHECDVQYVPGHKEKPTQSWTRWWWLAKHEERSHPWLIWHMSNYHVRFSDIIDHGSQHVPSPA